MFIQQEIGIIVPEVVLDKIKTSNATFFFELTRYNSVTKCQYVYNDDFVEVIGIQRVFRDSPYFTKTIENKANLPFLHLFYKLVYRVQWRIQITRLFVQLENKIADLLTK